MAVSLTKTPKLTDLSTITLSDPSTYTIQGGLTINSHPTWTTSDWSISSSSNSEIMDRIEAIEERLAILKIDEALHKKYPALKEAYDHYKTIEALVKGRDE